MNEDIKDKTALVTHHVLFRYKRISYAMKNAPAMFQRAMILILSKVKWQYALVYLDNVILFLKTPSPHIEQASIASRLIKSAGLTLKLKRCFLFYIRY